MDALTPWKPEAPEIYLNFQTEQFEGTVQPFSLQPEAQSSSLGLSVGTKLFLLSLFQFSNSFRPWELFGGDDLGRWFFVRDGDLGGWQYGLLIQRNRGFRFSKKKDSENEDDHET